MNYLFLPPCLTYKAYRSILRTPFQEDFLQAVKLPVAPIALGIIDGCDEIGLCRSHNTLFNLCPRRHQIRERNHTEVMSHGSTKKWCRLLESTNPRQRNNLHSPLYTLNSPLFRHFVNQRSHTIDACITTWNDDHILPLFCQFKSLQGTVTFTFHTRINTGTTFTDILLDELEIVFIANNHVSLFDRLQNSRCDIFRTTRTNAHYCNSSHSQKFLFCSQRYCKKTEFANHSGITKKRLPSFSVSEVFFLFRRAFPLLLKRRVWGVYGSPR